MKHLKKLFSLAILASTAFVQANGNNGCVPSPTFVARTQQRKMYQDVGEVGHVHLYDMECLYGTVSLLGGYTRSFRPRDIAECLFGPSLLNDCNCPGRTISIQGSGVANRNSQAWLADYFYLPTDFNGSMTFDPRITNGILNIDFFLGLNEWLCGLYIRIFGPIVHTTWDLNFCECIDAAGTASSVEGYFTPNGLTRSQLNPNATAFFCGQSLPNSTNNVVDGVTFTPLQRALFCCSDSKTGFADLRFELGWDFWQCEDWHLGVNLQFAAPTGSRRDCCCVFEPVVGNGNHWELGGGLTGHYMFWRSCEEDRNFGFYLDANFLHLFKATECRSFDLCNKPNSRYMLAQQMTSTITNNLSGSTTSAATLASVGEVPVAQFANVFVPVANLTCIPVRVSVGVQAEIVAWFNYTSCNFSWDLGYDFWGRSCEKFHCTDNCNDCNASCPSLLTAARDTYALKGDARVFGFTSEANGAVAVALSATQSNATICSGTNATNTTTGASRLNLGIDNPQFAYGNGSINNNARLLDDPNSADAEANHIRTSIQPQFINSEDISYVRTRGISHTVFTHFQYTWDCECWIPYLGVGGFAEFGKHDDCCNNNCNTNCNTTCTTACSTVCPTDFNCGPCVDCALSQWAVWVKAGLSFN